MKPKDLKKAVYFIFFCFIKLIFDEFFYNFRRKFQPIGDLNKLNQKTMAIKVF